MRVLLLLASFVPLSQLIACGPDCQSTCSRIYKANECGIDGPAQSEDDSIKKCMENCNNGLEKPGPVPEGYNPNDKASTSETIELETDKQTALWMECVQTTSCENLDQNVCAPIW